MSDVVFGLLISTVCTCFLILGVKNGWATMQFGSFSKEENPVGFYCAIMFNLMIIVAGLAFAVSSV